MRDSVRINTEGFWIFLEALRAGRRRSARSSRTASSYFVDEGCGRLTMDMVLVGDGGAALPEFKIARRLRDQATDMVLPSLEIAGPGGHWVEVSRAICAGGAEQRDAQMLEAYEEYYEAAQRRAAAHGATAHDVHRAVSKGFIDRGFKLGHVTGHSIGMTMIECPKIGEGDETELRENMVFSMHPHAIAPDGRGVPLHAGHVARHGGRRRAARGGLPMKIFDGTESRP